MKHLVEKGKTYRTRGGRLVKILRIYRDDYGNGLPVYGKSLVHGTWEANFWGPCGEYYGRGATQEDSRDLVELTET